jgi:protein-disulfide isomerase
MVGGLGMAAAAALTVQHYFAANFSTTPFQGSFCDLNGFLTCERVAAADVATIAGVPIGWFGLLLGGFFALTALFPSPEIERAARGTALFNGLLALGLVGYSTISLKSLCLLGAAYTLFSLLVAFVLKRVPPPVHSTGWRGPLLRLGTFGIVLVASGFAVVEYRDAVRGVQAGAVGTRAVNQFYSLPEVAWPSVVSPLWTARASERFEDAPIRIVEYADPLCIDCRVLHSQLQQLMKEFPGKMNVAYQFFQLEAKCNDVVEKDKHPGACDLSYMMAADPAKFAALEREIHEHMDEAKTAEWRAELARRFGVERALTDPAIQARVKQLIETGTEYERTSAKYAHGIRSTPTMIINNRMIIGTLPIEQLRAIFQALIDGASTQTGKFMENWLEPGCLIDEQEGPPKACK